ncbi:MAG: L-threonylcarbamoyladenylate synthase [Pseudomonadota bacterium]|nr:L-threonylcarbamoyladenylate synthase [Pseudomonadota bacterium]
MAIPFLEPNDAGLNQAANYLRAGKLTAFPTETVYGLGADAANEEAVARIFQVKGRPSFNPLIVHVRDTVQARALCDWNETAEAMARTFWPGALTLVLPRNPDAKLSTLVTAGLDTIALRVPDQSIAQALLARSDLAIAAPSANPSGSVSPTTAAHVAATFDSGIAGIVDGGACRIGLESTVLDLSGPTPMLLRPGGISTELISEALGKPPETREAGTVKSPGMLERHYAPRARLRLKAQTAEAGEVLLGFGPAAPADALNLSATGDLVEAAANLFALLHRLDDEDAATIAVMPIPETGLGRAINDRLRRAANRD